MIRISGETETYYLNPQDIVAIRVEHSWRKEGDEQIGVCHIKMRKGKGYSIAISRGTWITLMSKLESINDLSRI